MPITNVGINFIRKTVQAKGAKVLRCRQDPFHGINQTIKYPQGDISYALPRFCTPEMREARAMNRIAIRQAKAGSVKKTYPRATAEDLRRLTSETMEDSYSRVEWINPKDGKVYNLLKQGETEGGNVIVRILDEEGAYVKDAQLVPKSIKILDDPTEEVRYQLLGEQPILEQISHGELVTMFARKHNPFANIEFIKVNPDKTGDFEKQLKKLHKRIINGENVDYISLSIGKESRLGECTDILSKAGKTLEKFKQTEPFILPANF